MRISTKISIVLLSLIFVGFFTVQAFGQELSAEQKEVWEVQKARWELLKKGETDIEKLKANFHKAMFYWGWGNLFPVNGDRYAEILRSLVKVKSFELKPIEIKIFGSVAIVMYSYSYTNPWDRVISGRSTNIYMKQDGKWLLLSGMSSSCQNPSRCPP